ncbi:HEAT repeat domain-containing protein [Embleya sp. NPDC127516]|uniref:HEAT repeat domain-containing protein n=1 Tax=Embleya sp. NPDC127516 TaxID=3363990 RepID=UPI00380DBBF1
MDIEGAGIDHLIVQYVCGEDRAYDGLVAAGPVSLSRLLDTRAGRAAPSWNDALAEVRERLDALGREAFERLSTLQALLAKAFPDALFDAVADDPALEPVVMWTLQGLSDPRVLPILERGLRSPGSTRRQALHGMVKHGSAAHTDTIVACLGDEDDRWTAFEVLGHLGDERAIGPLLAWLAEDDRTAMMAEQALARIEERIGGPVTRPVWLDLELKEFTASSPLQPSRVTEVPAPGQTVVNGDVLVTLESELFETRLCADRSGTVAEVRVAVGDEISDAVVAVVLRARRRIG